MPAYKPNSLRLYLIRHGETEWSLSGQYTGRTDIPLTAHGESAAREVGKRLQHIPFAHVLMSPLQRAQQTCALAALKPATEIEPDLTEWSNGDYEGRTTAEIRELQPTWNLFRHGAPNGETPAQISERVDHLIARLRTLNGNVALFSHGHLCRVLAARWIGLSVEQAEHLLLSTASISILSYEHDCSDEPAIALWNAVSPEHPDTISLKQRALDRWENEGGEIPSEQCSNQQSLSPLKHFPLRLTEREKPKKQKQMKSNLRQLALSLVFVTGVSLSVGVAAEESQAELKAQAKITQEEATKTALAKVPGGKIKDAELEKENGKLIWSFDISMPKSTSITEIQVDAKTGKIVSTQIETAADQAKESAADKKAKK